MRGIAVWVASDSSEFGSRVRSKITKIEPDLLIADGDPEHLPIAAKIAVLSRITEIHSGDSRKSLSFSSASLKRFAAPQLAQSITRIFDSGAASDSVLCLLLALVKEGRIVDCSEMAARVAMTSEYSNHCRALAVMGLVACDQNSHLRKIARNILKAPKDWPSALLAEIIDELAPTYLSIIQLKRVLEARADGDDGVAGNFAQSIQRLADKLSAGTQETAELKSELAALIVGSQLPGSAHYHPLSRWSELAPALQVLCLASEDPKVDRKCKAHFFACLTAIWFRRKDYCGTTKIEELVKQVADTGIGRNLLFQWELEYALTHFPSNLNEPLVVHRSLVRGLTQDDILWLEELIRSEVTDMRIRLSALLERVRFWNAQGRPKEDEAGLRALGGDGGVIDCYLNRYLAPKNRSPEEDEWEAIMRMQETQEEKRLEGWLEWRRAILEDPRRSFVGDVLPRNRHLMLEWLMADSGKNGSYLVWGEGKGVDAAFSEQTRGAAALGFLEYWRRAEVTTFSEQQGDRSGTPYSWIYALTGVSIESQTPGWTTRLTDDEVRQATRIAMVEINGLANFIERLVLDRPQIVKEVLGRELCNQWSMCSKVPHLPLLQNVVNGSPALRLLLLDVAISCLLDWPTPSELSEEGHGSASHHLTEMIRIIQSCWEKVSGEQQSSLRRYCETTLREDPESKFSSMWLRLMFLIDEVAAIGLMQETIEAHPAPKRKLAAVRLFASLFGRFHRPSWIGSAGDSCDPRPLARLILMAYTYIVPEEDQERPSGVSYTPNDRDDAEQARSSLVNKLIEIEGAIADQEIERLAANPVCASIAGFLRARQKMRAENRADREYTISEICQIENRFECKPRDRDSLFRVMMARLDDLQDYLDTGDSVPLLTFQRIDSEEEMQLTIAMFLKQSSNGIYEIFREVEVKDRKRTDIQFSVSGFDLQSVIEIKVGEKPAWKVGPLLDALENQLVKRYLLQRNRKAGCLLITYGGHASECPKCGVKPRKKWKDPDTGKFLDFKGLIERLRIRAKEIVDEYNGEICLEVFGLDFRGPGSR
ncbi:MAG: hypothetical protein J0M04_22150 [Verrucomicrobia bacterium]|nr:hypothetical protein [Verrucomicrobiota bacterium]